MTTTNRLRFARMAAGGLAFAILFAFQPLGPANAQSLAFESREVTRLEAEVQREQAQAKAQAEALATELEGRFGGEREFLAAARRQGAEYRELEDSARADTRTQQERAERWRREAQNTTYTESTRATFSRSADEFARDAAASAVHAGNYAARAADREAEATTIEARIAEAEALLVRLKAILAYEPPPPPDDRETASEEPEERPPFKMSLQNTLGVWRPTEGGDWPFVIVREDPDFESYPNRLEAHSSTRVWKGNYEPSEVGDPSRGNLKGRVNLTYKPAPDEMNSEIPQWAREQVEGKLEWRIELDETGSPSDPRFSMKWFPGRVRWRETDPGTGEAWLDGDGTPLRFELAKDEGLDIESWSRPVLRVGLNRADHDPATHPLEALMKHQTFTVKVTLPYDMAKEQGTSLTVDVKAMSSGANTTLELTTPGFAGLRPVTYSHLGAASIADEGSEADRNPQFGSLAHIYSAEGTRLDIEIENEEVVEFRFGDTYERLPVYNTWVQRGLVRHRQGFERLGAIYAAIISGPSATQAQKEAAHRKQRQLSNYWSLRQSEQLTDLHKYNLGELYLGEDSPPVRYIGNELEVASIVQMSEAQIGELAISLSRPRQDSNYFNPLMKAFLEGLTGETLGNNAVRAADQIIWTSQSESALARYVIADTSANLASSAVRVAAEKGAFGLYDGYVGATGAGDLFLLMTGKDHFGKRQPKWRRVMVAVGLGSQTILHLSSANLSRSFGANGTGRAVNRIGGPVIANETIDVAARGRRVASVERVAGPTADLPGSVKSSQAKQTRVQFRGDTSVTGSPTCAPPRRALAGDGVFIDDLDLTNTVDDLATARSLYGNNVRIIDYGGPRLYDPQVGGTCNLMTVNYLAKKRLGRHITEVDGLQRAARIKLKQTRREVTQGTRTKAQAVPYEQLSSSELGDIISELGASNKVMREYAQRLGAKVSELDPLNNGRINLRAIRTALSNDYDVKLIIRLDSELHAIAITDIVADAEDIITHVRFYEPNLGRIVELPAGEFEGLIARNVKYGNTTLLRWGG